jgi:hypothetical protein
MKKLTKTQTQCIHNSILFEKPEKEIIQSNIDRYKCLKGFKVISASLNKVILMKPINSNKYHTVTVEIDSRVVKTKPIA